MCQLEFELYLEKNSPCGREFFSKYRDIALKMILQVSSTVCSKFVKGIRTLNSKSVFIKGYEMLQCILSELI
ncbi:hypothetical protein PMEGAS70_53890 [Priestia megaterium]